jgi:hypothetical protein
MPLSFQTNSTITTTIFQQQSGLSFLGLPLTDWITAITAIVVAVFAGVTVWEGTSNRRRDSIERQLERLYNPMFEIMDEALEERSEEEEKQQIMRVSLDHYTRLDEIFLSYGHYLNPILHDRIKELLRAPKESAEYDRPYPESKFMWCYMSIHAARDRLLSELYALERKRFRRPINQWPTKTLALLEQEG